MTPTLPFPHLPPPPETRKSRPIYLIGGESAAKLEPARAALYDTAVNHGVCPTFSGGRPTVIVRVPSQHRVILPGWQVASVLATADGFCLYQEERLFSHAKTNQQNRQ